MNKEIILGAIGFLLCAATGLVDIKLTSDITLAYLFSIFGVVAFAYYFNYGKYKENKQ